MSSLTTALTRDGAYTLTGWVHHPESPLSLAYNISMDSWMGKSKTLNHCLLLMNSVPSLPSSCWVYAMGLEVMLQLLLDLLSHHPKFHLVWAGFTVNNISITPTPSLRTTGIEQKPCARNQRLLPWHKSSLLQGFLAHCHLKSLDPLNQYYPEARETCQFWDFTLCLIN